MHHQHLGLHGAGLGGQSGLEIAMHADHRRHIRAGTGEVEDVGAAKAIADGRATGGVTHAMRLGGGCHGVKGGVDARPGLCGLLDQRPQELHGRFLPRGAARRAVHVGEENHIAFPGQVLGAFNGFLGHAHPVGGHEQEGQVLPRLVINKNAFAVQRADGIGNFLDFHGCSSFRFWGFMRRSRSRAPSPRRGAAWLPALAG